jgi:hypothetical protein
VEIEWSELFGATAINKSNPKQQSVIKKTGAVKTATENGLFIKSTSENAAALYELTGRKAAHFRK